MQWSRTRDDFHRFGWPFILRSDNGPCYSSREFQQFLEFYQIHHTPAAHTIHKAMESLKLWWAFQRNWWRSPSKMGRLWNYGLLQYRVRPIFSTIPSPLEALTGRKLRTSLPQIPSSIGKSVENSRIFQELIKCQLSTSTSYSMELKPGQLYLSRKYMGMSGRLESLSSQPRSLIPTGSSFQTVPSWQGPTRWPNPGHYLLILSWDPRARIGTIHNLFPLVHP